MKKMITKYFAMFSMLLFATLAVTSCSDDNNDKDEPDSPAEQLVGTWVLEEPDEKITLIFNSNGTGAVIDEYYYDGEKYNDYSSFKWKATDKELTLIYEDEVYTDSYVINGDTLYWDGIGYKKQ